MERRDSPTRRCHAEIRAASCGSLSVANDVTLPVLSSLLRWFGLDRPGMEAKGGRLGEVYDVRPNTPAPPLEALSGGDQQKLPLAKWLPTAWRLILLDKPTQGVDVGARLFSRNDASRDDAENLRLSRLFQMRCPERSGAAVSAASFGGCRLGRECRHAWYHCRNDPLYTAFSFLGLPALSQPIGFSSTGLPLSMQLVGRPFAQTRCCRSAWLSSMPTASDVEGGKTPNLPTNELGRLGCRLAIYPSAAFRAATAAIEKVYETIRAIGVATSGPTPLYPFYEMGRLMGFDEIRDFERRHAPRL